MEWLFEILECPLFLPIVISVFDIIMMIVIFRRTGKVYIKPASSKDSKDTSLSIVNDDLSALVDYHEQTAVQLRRLLNQYKKE